MIGRLVPRGMLADHRPRTLAEIAAELERAVDDPHTPARDLPAIAESLRRIRAVLAWREQGK